MVPNNLNLIPILFTISILLINPSSSFAASGIVSVEGVDVSYDMDGGTIDIIFLDPDFVELMILSETTSDGTLEITIPRELIDAQFDGTDDIFFILIDGFETDYLELESTANSRTLVIPFFAGDTIFEIIGTDVFGDLSSALIEIPSWVRNNAGWWADGLIEDIEFVSGIQYLISNGIMTV